jgi:hypothetical protein
MKETCEDCPDFDDCTEICDKIKSLLEEPSKNLREIPESRIRKIQGDFKKIRGDKSGIERFRKINPARVYENTTDTKIDWEETPPQPEAVEIENPERKKLLESIEIATRRGGLKLKRRFQSFLKCDKIVQIADRSGTTKQNIQKQFQLTVDKAYRVISKGKRTTKASITPLKFKKKINLPDI